VSVFIIKNIMLMYIDGFDMVKGIVHIYYCI